MSGGRVYSSAKNRSVSKSFYAMSKRTIDRFAESNNYFERNDIDPEEIANEKMNVTTIQRILALNGQQTWDGLFGMLKKIEEFKDWDPHTLLGFVKDRPFLFRNWDDKYGPTNCDWHYYLIVRYIATVLYLSDGKMEQRVLQRRLDKIEAFGRKINQFVGEGFEMMVAANKKYFETVQERPSTSGNKLRGRYPTTQNQKITYVRLTDKAYDMPSLWSDCALDFVRQKTKNLGEINYDKSIITNLHAYSVNKNSRRMFVRIRIKLNRKVIPQAFHAFVQPRYNMSDEEFNAIEKQSHLFLTAYRFEQQPKAVLHKAIKCSLLEDDFLESRAKCHPHIQFNSEKPNDPDIAEATTSVASINLAENQNQGHEDQEENSQQLKTLVDSLISSGENYTTESELAVLFPKIDGSKSYEKQEIVSFMERQPHLYESGKDGYRQYSQDLREKLTKVVEHVYNNQNLAMWEMKLNEIENFTELWRRVQCAFDTVEGGIFCKAKYRFKDGFFLQD